MGVQARTRSCGRGPREAARLRSGDAAPPRGADRRSRAVKIGRTPWTSWSSPRSAGPKGGLKAPLPTARSGSR